MICYCSGEQFCHGSDPSGQFDLPLHDSDGDKDEKYNAFCGGCVLEDVEEDDDFSDTDGWAPGRGFIPSLEQVNETVRSGAARLREERPKWLDSWVRII